jgi:hypothetical protein
VETTAELRAVRRVGAAVEGRSAPTDLRAELAEAVADLDAAGETLVGGSATAVSVRAAMAPHEATGAVARTVLVRRVQREAGGVRHDAESVTAARG